MMLSEQTIRAAVTRMMEAATSPGQVILFGSYARGTADSGSDLDLLVIEREIGDKPDEYMRLRDALGRLGPGIGVDLLLCQESEYARRSLVPGTVLYQARTEGKVVYDGLL
jgi:predicted nucleotidyltransferase